MRPRVRLAVIALTAASLGAVALDLRANPPQAQPCAKTGAETVSTDKAHYSPGDTVPITGRGFGADCQLSLEVMRPDGSDISPMTTDAAGRFAASYGLGEPVGDYVVEAFSDRPLAGWSLRTARG